MGRLWGSGYDKGPFWAERVDVDTSAFTGNLSIRDDTIQKALETIDAIEVGTGYVPYTGATANVDLGAYTLTATSVIETTPTLLRLNQETPQTMTGLTDGYLTLTAGVIGTSAGSGSVAWDGITGDQSDISLSGFTNDLTLFTPSDLFTDYGFTDNSATWDALVSFPGFTDLSTDYGFTDNSSDWDTAYGWGNHATAGYVTGTPWTAEGYITGISGSDVTTALGYTPLQSSDISDMATETWVGLQGFVTGTPWTSEGYVTGTPWTSEGYITGIDSDDVTTALGYTPLQSSDISDMATETWVGEQGFVTGTPWESEGYLTEETDPVFGTWQSTYDNHGNWDTAYGWGNHASAGYLTSVTAHDLLSATHGDTTASSVARGDIIVGMGATPKWDNLAIGTAGKCLVSDGTDVGWSTNALGTGAFATINQYAPLAGTNTWTNTNTFGSLGVSFLTLTGYGNGLLKTAGGAGLVGVASAGTDYPDPANTPTLSGANAFAGQNTIAQLAINGNNIAGMYLNVVGNMHIDNGALYFDDDAGGNRYIYGPANNSLVISPRGNNAPEGLFITRNGDADTNWVVFDCTSQEIGIGYTGTTSVTPRSVLDIKADVSSGANTPALFILANESTGTAAYAEIQVRNGTASTDAFRLMTIGSAWTTSGAFTQDAAYFGADSGLAGGLSIATRATDASASMRFYTGGSAAGNQRLAISKDGAITANAINYAADAQASDTYVITLDPVPAGYVTGMQIIFKAKTANTGAASLNVNGLGAKTIVKRVSTALASNDILASMFCLVVYDGTNFVLMNPVVN